MFYFYKYLDKHPINNLHKFYAEIITVWCNAKNGTTYSNALLATADCTEFVNKSPIDFKTTISNIYLEFSHLTTLQKKRMLQGLTINNDIEGLCGGKLNFLTFAEIKKMRKGLDTLLKDFGYYMYENAIKFTTAFTDKYGSHKVHFDNFKEENRKTNSMIGTCPFCGLNGLKTEYHKSKRDAYDHYLPKSKYAFNSINFKNLAPICDTCNEGYKGAKDPIFDKTKKKRRKAFYPYSTANDKIQIDVTLSKACNLLKPKIKDLAVSYSCIGKDPEINTWKDLFGIDEQLSTKILDRQQDWFENLIINYSSLKQAAVTNGELFTMSFQNYVQSRINVYKTRGISDMYFLKGAYLQELQRTGRMLQYCQPIASKLKTII